MTTEQFLEFCSCKHNKSRTEYKFTGIIFFTDHGDAYFKDADVECKDDFVILTNDKMTTTSGSNRYLHTKMAVNLSQVTKICF